MNYVLCNPEFDFVTRKILNEYNIECIDIPRCTRLPFPVKAHSDMLFFKLSNGSLLTEKSYYRENSEFFCHLEKLVKIKTSAITLAQNYPNDIAFDAFRVENTVFCLEKHTAPEILADSDKVVNVKQGYAKCSSLLIGSSVITADKCMYTAVTANGFDCLLISPEGITLDGYNCGFIGGASAVIEQEKTVIFFGNISLHPSYDLISSFCKEKGYALRFCGSSYPKDLGGALLFSV